MSATKINIVKCFRFSVLVLLMLFVTPTFAQKGEVKKSTKTETVDGKKYYLHTVEKSQTLYAIAKVYNLTVNDILLENPDALNGIKQGQTLRIPFEKRVAIVKNVPVDTSTFMHKVEAGQTLYSIAKLYNVTEDAILKLNPAAKTGLKLGEELRIPGKKNIATVITLPIKNGNDTAFKINKKALYNIALMLPLQLWNVDNINTDDILKGTQEFPAKSEAAVEFYEGTLIAIDSMRKVGMKLNLHVYDVDDGDSAKVQSILDKPEFKTMDLILGPLSPGPFYTVSNWANEHHVAIVSPVSPANRVLFKHPDAAKALPSFSTQMEQLAIFVGTHHTGDNVIMITSGNTKEQAAANTFRTNVSKILFPISGDTIKTTRGMNGLESLLKKDKTNILVIPSGSSATTQPFVSDLLRSLNTLSDKYVIMVYGLSSWMGYSNLDPEYLQKLQFHFIAPYFIDYDSCAATKRFLKKYDNAFHGDPSSYAFAGYDVSLFFLNALYVNGTDFYLKLPALKGEGLQQGFDFYRSDSECGYENRSVHFMQVVDYQLIKAK
ncbi:MAG: LysM peptidoglycan-binding domain-containing protein [Bacteroidetes bacterium]|nr:LysM peptidoglycan-binding domain-containing protein [Bacteroidota bacterium]